MTCQPELGSQMVAKWAVGLSGLPMARITAAGVGGEGVGGDPQRSGMPHASSRMTRTRRAWMPWKAASSWSAGLRPNATSSSSMCHSVWLTRPGRPAFLCRLPDVAPQDGADLRVRGCGGDDERLARVVDVEPPRGHPARDVGLADAVAGLDGDAAVVEQRLHDLALLRPGELGDPDAGVEPGRVCVVRGGQERHVGRHAHAPVQGQDVHEPAGRLRGLRAAGERAAAPPVGGPDGRGISCGVDQHAGIGVQAELVRGGRGVPGARVADRDPQAW
jgi:hypothetical protein